jgi:hypothetical protein
MCAACWTNVFEDVSSPTPDIEDRKLLRGVGKKLFRTMLPVTHSLPKTGQALGKFQSRRARLFVRWFNAPHGSSWAILYEASGQTLKLE